MRVAAIVGGLAHVKQARVLRARPEIVVATPGRLWELLREPEAAGEGARPCTFCFRCLSEFDILNSGDDMCWCVLACFCGDGCAAVHVTYLLSPTLDSPFLLCKRVLFCFCVCVCVWGGGGGRAAAFGCGLQPGGLDPG